MNKTTIKKLVLFPIILVFVLGISMYSEVLDFSLNDYNGKKVKLADFKGKKAVIVAFISTRCPVSNAYNERMEEINKKYSKIIPFIGINSNRAENIEEIRDHANKKNLTFTILKDPGNLVADKFKASFTPEIFVLDQSGKILYHGRIDDSRRKSGIKTKDLENALNEILEGKEISVKETKAFGCSIKRIKTNNEKK